jgi:hypothetical protein
MRKRIAFMALMIMSTTLSAEETGDHPVVKLPRPNSGSFTHKEAEECRSEILSNSPTPMLASWKKTSHGFSLHFHKDDRMTIYGSSGLMVAILPVNESLHNQSPKEVKKMADSIPRFGNPAGILITSDIPLKRSQNIHKILKGIFVPGIQIFYLRTDKDGVAVDPTDALESKAR